MKIAMGADKNGFELKESVKAYLEELGHEISDFGTLNLDNAIPWFDMVDDVAKRVQSGEFDRGILFCGTGMGVGVLANKYKGIVAACVESYYAAVKARAINNANILTMGGWIVGHRRGCEIAEVFLNTNQGDGLEDFRKELVKQGSAKLKELEEGLF